MNATTLERPYFAHLTDLPGIDFCREIVEPCEAWPDGALGIRVDDDFWCVAALPLDRYRDKPIHEIVAEFWPHYAAEATYAPDHGTVEQRVHMAEQFAADEKRRHDWLWEKFKELEAENARLKMMRPDLSPLSHKRHERERSWFVRQYEHLLIATAHKNEPREDQPGVCAKCGLFGSDRVHHPMWIEKHEAGYSPDLPALCQEPDD